MPDAKQSALALLPVVWTILKEERGLAESDQEELDKLKGLIREIRPSLAEAYSNEVIEKCHKECIKTLRELLHTSEEAIDDLWQREPKGNLGRPASYVCRLYHAGTSATVSEDVKRRLQDYKNNLASREILHPLPSKDAPSRSAGHCSLSTACSEEGDDALVGIDKPISQLVGWLTEEDSMSKVIFVHGAQGVGKTSLVGAVLRNEKVKRRFQYYVWIGDLRSWELGRGRAAALMEANVKMGVLTTRKRKQQDNCTLREAFRFMKAKNYSWILVLDDAGGADVLTSLRDELIESRPCVLVTTLVSSLASSSKDFFDSLRAKSGGAPPRSVDRLYVSHDFNHVSLNENDSRTLFCQKMSDNYTYNDDSKEASDCILRRCEGLPLVILATCKRLKHHQRSVTGAPDCVTWEKLSGRLEEELLSTGDTGGPIGSMITLRKEHLLDIRDCLFYLSIFPLDCPIRCSSMMRLWMAEEFIDQEDSKLDHEKAEDTLAKLLDHNVIWEKEKTSYGRLKACRVHNLLHQIIISESNDEEFAMIVANPRKELPDNIRHLSFHCDMECKFEDTRVEQLRSLLVFKKVYPEVMKKLLRQAKRLKVLDLQRHLNEEDKNYFPASLSYFPEEILHSKYLRYLSLRDTNLQRIPHGIGDLPYLETLDLKGTLVSELPDDILKLKALRHLLVYRSNRSPAAGSDPKLGVKAPSELGSLTLLQKLCMIELNPVKRSKLWAKRWKRTELLEELGKLANLRRLGISKLRSEDVGLLCSSIENLTKLEALHLIAVPGQKIDLSNSHEREAPKFLQRVHLTGCLGTLPNWILSPPGLVKLVLRGSQLNGDPLQRLGELPNLKHLELQQAFEVSVMTFVAGGFQRLCFLGLDTFNNLTSINVEEGALTALERLFLGRCSSLTSVPQVIEHSIQLKYLELHNMPREFMTAVETNEVRQHIKVIRKVWIDPAVEDTVMPQTDSQS